MARILPSDLSELSFSSGERAEIRTLDVLRTGLPSSYVVYHSVHWAKDTSHRSMFGEADFVIVNQGGEVAVIEQKSGTLEESSSGLVKRYSDGRKSVPVQIHRTLDGIREQFKRQSGHDISLDYLIYCPDYRVRDLNSAGVTSSRIVDARDASRLVERIIGVLPPGIASDFGKRVHRFFENVFYLVPDIHAHVVAGEKAMSRLSGGLVETLSSIEMQPLRLRIRGTAGCGKSIVASQFATSAATAGKKVLLVCFNRPLAERLKIACPRQVRVYTFYGLMDLFLTSRGHKLEYTRMNEPGFWEEVQEKVIGETIDPEWKFDALIVDEGQDFVPQWGDILSLFVKPQADLLWLEDPDQALRANQNDESPSKHAFHIIAGQFVGFRSRANYRSPETIARYIRNILPFDFLPSNPNPGLGVGLTTYTDGGEQGKRVGAIVTELMRTGFKHKDIVILSMRGHSKATLARESRVGPFTLSRPTGQYDLLGNQLMEPGQLTFDSVYRFKGQQAPAVILTDIDPGPDRLAHTERLLFTAMTRATVRLELVVRETNSILSRLASG